MEKFWVKDVQPGQRSTGIFLVVRKQEAHGKNGKIFLKLLLQDKTGSLDARVWNEAETLAPTFEINDLIEVEGPVEAFQGHPQLNVEKLGKPSAEAVGQLDPKDFLLVAPEPTPRVGPGPAGAAGPGALSTLRSELTRVQDGHVRALLLSFVDDPEVAARLRIAPAAKEIHHAYPGGLLEHLLSCVRLAQRVADHYPMVDRDLLVAGAFLHDLGKIAELTIDHGSTAYTDEGRLIGHIVLNAQWIHERARAIDGFPPELEQHLVHMVLGHHGRLEYGSPKLPMTIEAMLVHEIDELDSRVNAMLSQLSRGNPADRWSEPQKPYERLLFKAALPTEGGQRRGPAFRSFRRFEKKKRVPSARPEVEHATGGEGVAEPPRERRVRPARPERGERPQRTERPERAERPPRPPREPRQGEKLTFKPFAALVEEAGSEAEAPPAEPETPAAPADSAVPEAQGEP